MEVHPGHGQTHINTKASANRNATPAGWNSPRLQTPSHSLGSSCLAATDPSLPMGIRGSNRFQPFGPEVIYVMSMQKTCLSINYYSTISSDSVNHHPPLTQLTIKISGATLIPNTGRATIHSASTLPLLTWHPSWPHTQDEGSGQLRLTRDWARIAWQRP